MPFSRATVAGIQGACNGIMWEAKHLVNLVLGLSPLLLTACGGEGSSDTSPNDHQTEIDALATETGSNSLACSQRGGTCVDDAPASDPPGFTVTCPEGFALEDGRTSATKGGTDMINSSLALGCSRNLGGTTKPALCCLPKAGAG